MLTAKLLLWKSAMEDLHRQQCLANYFELDCFSAIYVFIYSVSFKSVQLDISYVCLLYFSHSPKQKLLRCVFPQQYWDYGANSAHMVDYDYTYHLSLWRKSACHIAQDPRAVSSNQDRVHVYLEWKRVAVVTQFLQKEHEDITNKRSCQTMVYNYPWT